MAYRYGASRCGIRLKGLIRLFGVGCAAEPCGGHSGRRHFLLCGRCRLCRLCPAHGTRPGQAGGPAVRARPRVPAVPADIGAGLAAVGHHLVGGKLDAAHGARDRGGGAATVLARRWGGRVPRGGFVHHRGTAGSSGPPAGGIATAEQACEATVPPHGSLSPSPGAGARARQQAGERARYNQRNHLRAAGSGKLRKLCLSRPNRIPCNPTACGDSKYARRYRLPGCVPRTPRPAGSHGCDNLGDSHHVVTTMESLLVLVWLRWLTGLVERVADVLACVLDLLADLAGRAAYSLALSPCLKVRIAGRPAHVLLGLAPAHLEPVAELVHETHVVRLHFAMR